jgi:NhaP-type Na+/H+ or K+/H+ antiporter
VEIEHILRDFGLILGAGLASQLLATLTKIPQMVVLVAAGALIGPSVLGLVSNPLGGSAYLATFVMGLMVGNMELLGLGHHDEHAQPLRASLVSMSASPVLALPSCARGINASCKEVLRSGWSYGTTR